MGDSCGIVLVAVFVCLVSVQSLIWWVVWLADVYVVEPCAGVVYVDGAGGGHGVWIDAAEYHACIFT